MTPGQGIGVDPAALRAAAAAARDAGSMIAGADLGGDAEQASAALPGAESATAATWLAGSWRRGISGWARQASSHADNLTGTAQSYASTDNDNAAVFGAVSPPSAAPSSSAAGGPAPGPSANAILDALSPGGQPGTVPRGSR